MTTTHLQGLTIGDDGLTLGTGSQTNVGTLSSSSQTGYHLSSSATSVFNVYADDNNATLGTEVYTNIRARTMLFKDAADVTIVSSRGQIKAANGVDFATGVFAGVQGYMELVGDTTINSGAKWWGVDSSIDVPSGKTLTVASGGIAAGFHAELTGSGTATQSSGGILAGLYIDEQISNKKWGYGIYMTGGSAYQAVKIGTLSSTTAGSGITVTSSFPTAVEVHADDGDSALGSGVTARAIDGRFMNYGSVAAETWGVQGKCKLSAVARTANVAAGVVGAFESTGTCSTATGSGNTFCAGVMGRVGGGGTFTIGTGTYVCGVLAFYNTSITNAFTNTGTVAFMATASDIAGTGDWDYGVYIEDASKAWYSTTTLSGGSTTTRNAMGLVVTDNATNSGNYQRGIHVDYTAAGAKTSNGEANVIAYDLTVSGNTPYAYGYVGYIVASGDPTIGQVAGISLYIDDTGSAVGHLTAVDIGLAGGSNSPSDKHCFFRLRNHTAGQPPADTFRFEGTPHSDYLFGFESVSLPIVAASVSGSQTHKIKVRIGTTDYYIPLNTA